MSRGQVDTLSFALDAPWCRFADVAERMRFAHHLLLASIVWGYCAPLIQKGRGAEPNDQTRPAAVGDASAQWSHQRVAERAYATATTAQLLDTERRAIACVMDTNDEAERALVGLAQAVLEAWARHERQQSAADARLAYCRIVAAQLQLQRLDKSLPLLESLEHLAETSEQLGLADEPTDTDARDRLADQRLQLEDRWFEIDFGRQRLWGQLRLLLHDESFTENKAVLIGPLLTEIAHQSRGSATDLDLNGLTQRAIQQRQDLRALETLCHCLNEDSLPAARHLLAGLVPLSGLTPLGNPPALAKPLMWLRCNGRATEDLAARRTQCQQLVVARRTQIRAEVRDAVLQLREAWAREDVARRRVNAAQRAAERQRVTEDLGRALPGTRLRAELRTHELSAQLLRQQLAIAEANIALQRALGEAR